MQLSGNLRNFSLPELLHVMASGQKSGRLIIATPSGEASIYLENGALTHAEVDAHVGEEAVFTIFRLTEGDFSFIGGAKAKRHTVFFDHTTLMLEAARLHDEGLDVSMHDLGFTDGHLSAAFAQEDEVSAAAQPSGEEGEDEREISFHPHLLEAVGNLSERLERCPELTGYVVHSRDGLLKSGEQASGGTALSPPEPKALAQAFDCAEELGETLGAGKLNCVALSASGGERVVFFQISGLMAMTWPARGVKPLDILTKVTALSALPAGGAVTVAQ